jgi:hypothetical protein
MMYIVERLPCVMILLPSLMKIGRGFQELLRFCFRNLSGSSIILTRLSGPRSRPTRYECNTRLRNYI